MDNERITRNAAQCANCYDIVESKHRHDFVMCKCGAVGVDGGLAYLRRVTNGTDSLIEMCEYGPKLPTDMCDND